MRLADEKVIDNSALVETAAEVNLIFRALISQKYFNGALKLRRFAKKNGTIFMVEAIEVPCELLLHGVNQDTSKDVGLFCRIAFNDGDIIVDLIISNN